MNVEIAQVSTWWLLCWSSDKLPSLVTERSLKLTSVTNSQWLHQARTEYRTSIKTLGSKHSRVLGGRGPWERRELCTTSCTPFVPSFDCLPTYIFLFCFVCVWERQTERERDRDRETERWGSLTPYVGPRDQVYTVRTFTHWTILPAFL